MSPQILFDYPSESAFPPEIFYRTAAKLTNLIIE